MEERLRLLEAKVKELEERLGELEADFKELVEALVAAYEEGAYHEEEEETQ